MFAYLMTLNKKKLEEEIRTSGIYLTRNLVSEIFEVNFDNVVFDEVLNRLYVRDKEGSAIASISLETGDIRCCRSYEEKARNFARMYEKEGDRKISIDKKY